MTTPPKTAAPGASTQPAFELRMLVITASTRPQRFGHQVAAWFLDHVEGHPAFKTSHIDLTELDIPAHIGTSASAQQRLHTDAGTEIEAADGIVIVTPEYNHSYPGTLKNFIDHFHTEWAGRPISFVGYGGVSGGLRSIEHLRLVFAELRAATLRETISFHNPHGAFYETGNPPDPAAASDAADRLLAEMTWWATALANARARQPYPGQ
jgi:NAD(P)H-dependent FMN reductase